MFAKICIKSPLLPILVGILTVASMFATNAGRLGWGQLWIPLAFVTVWATVCWFIISIIPKGRVISGAVASVVVLITMLWGLFPQLPQKYVMTGDLISLLVWMVGCILVVRFYKKVNKALPVVSVVVVLAILFSFGQATFNIVKADRDEITGQGVADVNNESYPDIYFIIPDRFGSPVALRESGLDEENINWFVGELEDRGFYIREDALSSDPINPDDHSVSTTRTLRFLASVMNFGQDIDLYISYNEAGKMVRNPEVIDVLHGMGYTCYNIGSWYPETAISRAADYNYVYEAGNIVQRLYVQEFSAAVIDRSIWRYFSWTGEETERDRQMFQLESVKEIASNDTSPKFTFVHLILPHPPFIWTAYGEPQDSDADLMTLYLEQVVFTECYLLDMIDVIDSDAIIILQSDEGVCFTDPDMNYDLTNEQWNGVLTAWRILGADVGELETVGQTEILDYVISLAERNSGN